MRFISISIVSLVLIAVIGWALFSHKTENPSSVARVATPPTTSTLAGPAQNTPSLLSSGTAASVSASSRRSTDDFSMLKTASREEILAFVQDMLAKGRPLEDVIALLDYLAAIKPEFTLDLARDIGRTDDERHVLLLAVLDDWAHADPVTALQWAFQKSSQYNVAGNASLLYVVLEQVTADDPQSALAAAEYALKQPPNELPGTSANEVARLTVEALTKAGHTDLARQAIENWAHGPEAANLDGAVYEVVAMSVAQNSAGDAAGWLQSLPASPARDQALATIETVWAQSAPAAAIVWAQGLSQADGRADAVTNIFVHWLNEDRAAALQWLADHQYSPDHDRLIAAATADSNPAPAQP
ncbi:MAG TPA: hypothetical protein VGP21_01995 [Opitutaceae bacterium]|nr:hypothetical protein [Opitutaceae bacterium]